MFYLVKHGSHTASRSLKNEGSSNSSQLIVVFTEDVLAPSSQNMRAYADALLYVSNLWELAIFIL